MQTDLIGSEDKVTLYAHVGHDPLNKADPKAEFTMLVGAFMGGVSELALIAVEANVGFEAVAERVVISAVSGAVGLGLGAKVGQVANLGRKFASKTILTANGPINIGKAITGAINGAVTGATTGAVFSGASSERKQAVGVGKAASQVVLLTQR
jgi:hypothetical protein